MRFLGRRAKRLCLINASGPLDLGSLGSLGSTSDISTPMNSASREVSPCHLENLQIFCILNLRISRVNTIEIDRKQIKIYRIQLIHMEQLGTTWNNLERHCSWMIQEQNSNPESLPLHSVPLLNLLGLSHVPFNLEIREIRNLKHWSDISLQFLLRRIFFTSVIICFFCDWKKNIPGFQAFRRCKIL